MKRADLDWNDLRYFLAAVRAGTLAGAARALGVKHSTIGRRLDALEHALGGAIVIRGEQGLELTALGRKLMPHAEVMERSVLELENEAASQVARVRVAVPTGLVRAYTPYLVDFRREHPDIDLEFLSSSLPADLHKGEAELALRVGPIADDNLIVQKIGEVGFSMYASSEYLARHAAPADPRDLSGQEVLGFHSRLAFTPGAQWLAKHGAGARVVLVNREIVEMTAAAVAGVGLAFLPCTVAESEPALKRLTPQTLGTIAVSVTYRREATMARPVSVVVKFLVSALRARIREIERMSAGQAR
jgi:DNA-binding transcriptional LysR family regulator